jgi:O-antigen/teichoic acid export membrane protein
VTTPEGSSRVNPSGAARNTVFALLTQLSTAVFSAALTIFLVRELGPREFGLFSLAVSIGALVLLPSDFGISGSTARFAAERRTEPGAVASLLSDALRLKLAIGGVVSAAMILLAGPIAAAYGEPSLAWPIRWLAIAVLGQSLVAFYRYAFNALRDASVGLRIVLGESAVECGASVALVVAAGGAAGASAGRAAGYAFGALLALGMTVRRLGPRVIRRSHRLGDARRRLARYAGALFVIETAFAASVQVAPLMIGGFLGPREVGLFQAPNRLLVVLGYPGVSLSHGVAPRMARSEDHEPDVETFAGGLRFLIIFHALILAPLLVWAGPIVDLVLGPDYERSAEIIQVLGPYIFVMGLSNVLAVGLNYMGEARRRLPVSVMEVGLTVGLTAALVPTIGLVGAAIAADVVSVLFVVLLLRIIVRLVDLPLRPLFLATVRALLAAAAAAGVLLAYGTEFLSIGEWLVGGAGALAAFAGVLLVTGELTLDELGRWWRAARSAAGK